VWFGAVLIIAPVLCEIGGSSDTIALEYLKGKKNQIRGVRKISGVP
jgi:hypothetical protein